jgi:hypothetical protein
MFGATTVEIGLKSFGWEISSKGLKLPYTVFGNMNFFSTSFFLATLSSNSVHTTFKYVWGNHGRNWAQKFWVGKFIEGSQATLYGLWEHEFFFDFLFFGYFVIE